MRDGIIVGVEYALRIGIDEGIRRSRIEAFGAIRRAAEIMRWHEAEAASWKARGIIDTSENYEWCADQIRLAIRAAIGSEKA